MTETWTDGYLAELTYTDGFYRELSPSFLQFIGLLTGNALDLTDIDYCELGCGHGYSTNLNAAANPQCRFFANDFNPTQILNARTLAKQAGIENIRFFDDSFADFRTNPALPEAFDVIALHGIYSWVNQDNRHHIIEFIKSRLKVGGLVYISYNTMPGCADLLPMRRLMRERSEQSNEPVLSRIEDALRFAEKISRNSKFFSDHPRLEKRLRGLRKESPAYLAHEYFNEHWEPFYFEDVVHDLSAAKLTFMGSANPLAHLATINLTREQLECLAEEPDPIRREGLRDYMVNQQFRRDLFLKGEARLVGQAIGNAWQSARFALNKPVADIPMEVKSVRGKATMQRDIYDPVLKALSGAVTSIGDLQKKNEIIAQMSPGDLVQIIKILVGAKHLDPALPESGLDARIRVTRSFNHAVCQKAKMSDKRRYLASPITGNGLRIDHLDLLFLATLFEQETDPVSTVLKDLRTLGKRMIRDGKVIETEANIRSDLQNRFERFQADRLPILEQHCIV